MTANQKMLETQESSSPHQLSRPYFNTSTTTATLCTRHRRGTYIRTLMVNFSLTTSTQFLSLKMSTVPFLTFWQITSPQLKQSLLSTGINQPIGLNTLGLPAITTFFATNIDTSQMNTRLTSANFKCSPHALCELRHNIALNRTLRDKAAQRWLALRYASVTI